MHKIWFDEAMVRLPLLAKSGQSYPVVDTIIKIMGDITKYKNFMISPF